jgi:hypothetical protein
MSTTVHLHGDHERHDDSARYFCRVHGWVAVPQSNAAIHFTPEVYREMLSVGLIKPNGLQTFKARRVHDFAGTS